jgi:PAS domain S-box-containing protein
MSVGMFEREIRELRAKIGKFRAHAAEAAHDDPLTEEALVDLSSAVEELRVASEELSQKQRDLESAHFEIERERRRFQDLFERAPDGYVVTDLEGRIVEANQAAVRLLQVPLSTLRGTGFVSRVDASSVLDWNHLLRPRGTRTADLNLRLRLRRRGGDSFTADITSTVLLGDDGAPADSGCRSTI